MVRQAGQRRQPAKVADVGLDKATAQTLTDSAPDADQIAEPDSEPDPEAKPQTRPKPKGKSKADAVLALLRRRNGARMEEIVAATGWQPHSARAWISGQRKQGLLIERSREGDGSSRYRLVPMAGGKPK